MTEDLKSTLPEGFEELVAARNFKSLRQIFRTAEPADIAEAIGRFTIPESAVLFRLLPHGKRAEVFSFLTFEMQVELIESLPEVIVSNLMNDLDSDDRTKFLEDLPFEIRQLVLAKLTPEERSMAARLLAYPEDSVGRMMSLEFLSASSELKVHQCYNYIRWHAREHDELHPHLFVVDHEGLYLGEVSYSALILADPQTLSLGQIMDKATAVLKATDPNTSAVDFFRKYDRSYIPVVDEAGKLLGMVTADDVFDVAEEEATEDIQQFGGHATLEYSYFQTPIFTIFRKRAGWLAFIFVGELFTGTALRHYDDALAQMRFLTYFLPLIVSSGGNSGSQSASLIIRGIAVREMVQRDWYRVFFREIAMGLCLGAVLGSIGFFRALMWGDTSQVGLTVFATLVAVTCFGALTGSMLPFALKAMKLDPALGSSPFIATFVDVVGIMIFFNIALYLARVW